MRVWLVLGVLLLAGCSDPGDAPGPTTKPPTTTGGASGTPATAPATPVEVPLLSDFNFVGCYAGTVQSAVPAATAQSWLPANFTVAEEGGNAVLGLTLAQCTNLTTPSVTVGQFWIGFLSIPLSEVANHTIESPRYVLRVLSSNDTPAAVWEQAGFDVHRGNATMIVDAQLESVSAARWTFGNYSMDAQVFTPGSLSESYTWVAEHPVGGLLRWTTTQEARYDEGVGSFRTAADDGTRSAQDPSGAFRGTARHGPSEWSAMNLVWVAPTA